MIQIFGKTVTQGPVPFPFGHPLGYPDHLAFFPVPKGKQGHGPTLDAKNPIGRGQFEMNQIMGIVRDGGQNVLTVLSYLIIRKNSVIPAQRESRVRELGPDSEILFSGRDQAWHSR
jgi:hypothetical protein